MGKTERAEKLQCLLRQLFQFENEDDCDAGIHRIINIKRKEVADFIEKDLFEIIQHELKDRGKDATSLRKVEVDTQFQEEVYGAISDSFVRGL